MPYEESLYQGHLPRKEREGGGILLAARLVSTYSYRPGRGVHLNSLDMLLCRVYKPHTYTDSHSAISVIGRVVYTCIISLLVEWSSSLLQLGLRSMPLHVYTHLVPWPHHISHENVNIVHLISKVNNTVGT